MKALEMAEDQVHTLEEQVERLEHDLAEASRVQDLARVQQLHDDYASAQAKLETAKDAWTELAE